jgi:hypothetical protein
LYSSPSIIRIIKSRKMRWAGHVERMGRSGARIDCWWESQSAYRLLVGKPEGKRPLGRPRRRCVYNIRMDLGELGWGDVDWIGLIRIGTDESSCEFGIEPSCSMKCWEAIERPNI